MPSPTQREEREKAEREAAAKKAKTPPPKKGTDPSIGGAIDAIKKRKEMLDEL